MRRETQCNEIKQLWVTIRVRFDGGDGGTCPPHWLIASPPLDCEMTSQGGMSDIPPTGTSDLCDIPLTAINIWMNYA
jgi:hypothetical protein